MICMLVDSMRRTLIIALLSLPTLASAQLRPLWPGFTCNHEPMRTTLMGAALGGVVVPGLALLPDSDHRIDPSERMAYFWGFTAGSSITAAVAHGLAAERCPSPRPAFDPTRACGKHTARGALTGSFVGAVTAFDVSPILLLPAAALGSTAERRFNLDHAMGMMAAAGAVLGMPMGAALAYKDCIGA